MNDDDISGAMTTERLGTFSEAWARGDVDELMTYVTDDVVYSASVGPEPGETWRGRDAVRFGFALMLAHDAGATSRSDGAWVFGDHGVALWSYVTTDEAGEEVVEVKGIDHFRFVGDRIALKDAYRKTR